ncbi:unnamed protein product [Amoebophrya sp. A120]|nr:unnamed protein product [Amoebophrya sp. A120]|eukprot:GSA120T00012715001.1
MGGEESKEEEPPAPPKRASSGRKSGQKKAPRRIRISERASETRSSEDYDAPGRGSRHELLSSGGLELRSQNEESEAFVNPAAPPPRAVSRPQSGGQQAAPSSFDSGAARTRVIAVRNSRTNHEHIGIAPGMMPTSAPGSLLDSPSAASAPVGYNAPVSDTPAARPASSSNPPPSSNEPPSKPPPAGRGGLPSMMPQSEERMQSAAYEENVYSTGGSAAEEFPPPSSAAEAAPPPEPVHQAADLGGAGKVQMPQVVDDSPLLPPSHSRDLAEHVYISREMQLVEETIHFVHQASSTRVSQFCIDSYIAYLAVMVKSGRLLKIVSRWRKVRVLIKMMQLAESPRPKTEQVDAAILDHEIATQYDLDFALFLAAEQCFWRGTPALGSSDGNEAVRAHGQTHLISNPRNWEALLITLKFLAILLPNTSLMRSKSMQELSDLPPDYGAYWSAPSISLLNPEEEDILNANPWYQVMLRVLEASDGTSVTTKVTTDQLNAMSSARDVAMRVTKELRVINLIVKMRQGDDGAFHRLGQLPMSDSRHLGADEIIQAIAPPKKAGLGANKSSRADPLGMDYEEEEKGRERGEAQRVINGAVRELRAAQKERKEEQARVMRTERGMAPSKGRRIQVLRTGNQKMTTVNAGRLRSYVTLINYNLAQAGKPGAKNHVYTPEDIRALNYLQHMAHHIDPAQAMAMHRMSEGEADRHAGGYKKQVAQDRWKKICGFGEVMGRSSLEMRRFSELGGSQISSVGGSGGRRSRASEAFQPQNAEEARAMSDLHFRQSANALQNAGMLPLQGRGSTAHEVNSALSNERKRRSMGYDDGRDSTGSIERGPAVTGALMQRPRGEPVHGTTGMNVNAQLQQQQQQPAQQQELAPAEEPGFLQKLFGGGTTKPSGSEKSTPREQTPPIDNGDDDEDLSDTPGFFENLFGRGGDEKPRPSGTSGGLPNLAGGPPARLSAGPASAGPKAAPPRNAPASPPRGQPKEEPSPTPQSSARESGGPGSRPRELRGIVRASMALNRSFGTAKGNNLPSGITSSQQAYPASSQGPGSRAPQSGKPATGGKGAGAGLKQNPNNRNQGTGIKDFLGSAHTDGGEDEQEPEEDEPEEEEEEVGFFGRLFGWGTPSGSEKSTPRKKSKAEAAPPKSNEKKRGERANTRDSSQLESGARDSKPPAEEDEEPGFFANAWNWLTGQESPKTSARSESTATGAADNSAKGKGKGMGSNLQRPSGSERAGPSSPGEPKSYNALQELSMPSRRRPSYAPWSEAEFWWEGPLEDEEDPWEYMRQMCAVQWLAHHRNEEDELFPPPEEVDEVTYRIATHGKTDGADPLALLNAKIPTSAGGGGIRSGLQRQNSPASRGPASRPADTTDSDEDWGDAGNGGWMTALDHDMDVPESQVFTGRANIAQDWHDEDSASQTGGDLSDFLGSQMASGIGGMSMGAPQKGTGKKGKR